MEVGLLAFLTLALVLGVASTIERWEQRLSSVSTIAWFVVAGVIGIATRINFALIALVLAGWLLVWAPDRRHQSQIGWFAVGPLIVAIVAISASQKIYFGDWLTNTYHLKIEGFSVSVRVVRGLLNRGRFGHIGLMGLRGAPLKQIATTEENRKHLPFAA